MHNPSTDVLDRFRLNAVADVPEPATGLIGPRGSDYPPLKILAHVRHSRSRFAQRGALKSSVQIDLE